MQKMTSAVRGMESAKNETGIHWIGTNGFLIVISDVTLVITKNLPYTARYSNIGQCGVAG